MAEVNAISLLNDANLIAYYRFNSGALTTDSKGANTLTNNNTVGELASGKYGVSADYGSANSNKYLSRATNIGIDGGACTFSIWLKMRRTDAYQVIIQQANSNSKVRFIMAYNNTTGLVFIRSKAYVGDDTCTIANTLDTTTWHHVVLTYDGTTLRGYLDGSTTESVASSGNGTTSGVDKFYIGNEVNDGNYLSAYIDDLSVFTRALSAAEVATLYADTAIKKILGVSQASIRKIANAYNTVPQELNGSPLLTNANLRAYYRFEKGFLTRDSSPNGYTLGNGNVPSEIDGKFGGAVSYSSAFHYVVSVLGCAATAYSFSFWAKLPDEIASGTWDFMVMRWATNNVSAFIRYEYNGGTRRLSFWRAKSGVADQGFTYNITLGTTNWYHIVMTYDGTTIRGYVNGVEIGTVAASGDGTNAETNNFQIGAFANYYNGYIDDLSVFSDQLTLPEIVSLNTGVGLKKFMGVANG